MEGDIQGGVVVYPAFFKTIVEPNGKYRFVVNITNNESETLTVSSSMAEFSQSENNQNQYQLSDKFDGWFNTPSIKVEPKKTEEIYIDLDFPGSEDIDSGSYYPAIVLSISPEENESTVSITTESVIPLYLAVSNTYNEDITISKFNIPSITVGKKIEFSIQLENSGNTYISPISYLEFVEHDLTNSDNKTRIEALPVTKGEKTLLPDSKSEEEVTWSRETFGKYETTLYVLSGNNEIVNQSKTFWLVPPETLTYFAGILLAITLLMICLVGYKIKKKQK